jgi:hypothetical protein
MMKDIASGQQTFSGILVCNDPDRSRDAVLVTSIYPEKDTHANLAYHVGVLAKEEWEALVRNGIEDPLNPGQTFDVELRMVADGMARRAGVGSGSAHATYSNEYSITPRQSDKDLKLLIPMSRTRRFVGDNQPPSTCTTHQQRLQYARTTGHGVISSWLLPVDIWCLILDHLHGQLLSYNTTFAHWLRFSLSHGLDLDVLAGHLRLCVGINNTVVFHDPGTKTTNVGLKGNDVKAWRRAGSRAWRCKQHDLLPNASAAARHSTDIAWELLGKAWETAECDPYPGQDRVFRWGVLRFLRVSFATYGIRFGTPTLRQLLDQAPFFIQVQICIVTITTH